MADDEFNFDFENSLEPPQNNQQVSFDLMLSCISEFSRVSPKGFWLQNGAHIAPDLPPGAPIGQSIGNYKKNYRQVWRYLYSKG